MAVNAALLVPSVIALVLALYPAPWHIRTRNIATCSMIFWMTCLNLVDTVNCIVWGDNADIKASVWGDISTTVKVGYNYGLPIAHFVLAKQLESYTTLRPKSPLYDARSRQKHRLFDLSISIGGPILGILLHLTNMDRRFYIVEGFGPQPATYWDTWGVIWMAIVPIVIAGAVATYTVMALVNIHLRRQQMLSMIASDASVNRDQFYRLMFLTLAELGTCGLRAIFNLMSFQNGPQPMGQRGPPTRNMTIIEQIFSEQISDRGMLVLRLQFFTVIACSYVFFLCFATSTETKKFYWGVLRKVFPCIPERQHHNQRLSKLASFDSSVDRSRGGKSFAGYSFSSQSASGGGVNGNGTQSVSDSISPLETKGDMSLMDMLGGPSSAGLDSPNMDSPVTPHLAKDAVVGGNNKSRQWREGSEPWLKSGGDVDIAEVELDKKDPSRNV